MAKPTHVRAIAHLLETGDFADSIEAAKAVLAEAERLREGDEFWVLVSHYGRNIYFGTGPFPTRNAVTRWAEKNGMPEGGLHVPVRCKTSAYRRQQEGWAA